MRHLQSFFGLMFCLLIQSIAEAAYLPLQYINTAYESNIKTVMLTQAGSLERLPAIDLGSNQQLNLVFDDMMPESDNYQYTFIHCSSDWKPSNLKPNEYLTGNLFQNINTYAFSTTTFQVYTHYQITFPENEMKPKLSGNYILKLYINFDENDLILTRRFMVVDDKFVITPSVKVATNPNVRFSDQEIDFSVNMGDNIVPNPMMDVKATILQNLRWDNAIFDLKPRFINGKILDYNYETGNLFKGGNEFRYFDIRNLRYLSPNVRRKYDENNVKHAVLYSDAIRGNLPYVQMIDFNGKVVIDNRDGIAKAEIGADYAAVHFNLVSDQQAKDVYIFGELSDWQLKDDFKMEWNPKALQYEKELMLKQAYYNYYYVTADQLNVADQSVIEGNFSNTENDYHILLYNKNQFMQYDELLGVISSNSAAKK